MADLQETKLVYLREDGAEIQRQKDRALHEDMAYVLGDHTGMTEEEEALLEKALAEVVSLGPTSLHADHCIVILNWLLDAGSVLSGQSAL